MPQRAYILDRPATCTSAVVFASPHSGKDYCKTFLNQVFLDAHSLRSSEDAFVDRLFEAVVDFGSPFLKAAAPRAYIDYNRGRDELDPALIQGLRDSGSNPRVASGLGVIPRVVANSRAIYSGKLSRAEADTRLMQFWHPYHRALQGLLDAARQRFGQAILIDCHSMPHEALETWRSVNGKRPDIVLGDRFGVSASSDIVERVEGAFQSAGFSVSRNAPFAGAYVTQHYGRPARAQHALQIEIDRALYMDEQRIEPRPEFEDFRAKLNDVIAEIVAIGRPEQRLAAE